MEHAFLLETRECVRVEHLSPFVAVVACRITDRTAEQVAETTRHGWLLSFERHEVAVEDLAGQLVEVCAFGGGMVHVQLEVELAKGELAHDVAGAAVVLCGQHLLEQPGRNRLASFMMTGEEVQALTLPAEVFEQLGR